MGFLVTGRPRNKPVTVRLGLDSLQPIGISPMGRNLAVCGRIWVQPSAKFRGENGESEKRVPNVWGLNDLLKFLTLLSVIYVLVRAA